MDRDAEASIVADAELRSALTAKDPSNICSKRALDPSSSNMSVAVLGHRLHALFDSQHVYNHHAVYSQHNWTARSLESSNHHSPCSKFEMLAICMACMLLSPLPHPRPWKIYMAVLCSIASSVQLSE